MPFMVNLRTGKLLHLEIRRLFLQRVSIIIQKSIELNQEPMLQDRKPDL